MNNNASIINFENHMEILLLKYLLKCRAINKETYSRVMKNYTIKEGKEVA